MLSLISDLKSVENSFIDVLFLRFAQKQYINFSR